IPTGQDQGASAQSGRAYNSTALASAHCYRFQPRRKEGPSLAMPAMLEHDGNPLEVTFQLERLPQTLSFASALAASRTESMRAYNSTALASAHCYRFQPRRKAGPSFAMPAMLEHDGNPLEVTFQLERLPQTLSFASALAASRTESMRVWTNGLIVRFFNVTIPTGQERKARSTGNTLNAKCWRAKCSTEPDCTATNRPVFSK